MALKIIDDSHKYTIVKAGDQPGPGGARHNYVVVKKLQEGETEQQTLAHIDFQNGPIKEAGVNGVMDENLIAIVIDRLMGFQAGPYKCAENQEALEFFQAGLDALKSRTAKREKQGIEGTHKVGTETTGGGQLSAGPSVKLTANDVAEYKALHKENMEKLNEVVDGEVDADNPKEITNPNASCLVAHCIENQIKMLHIINVAEGKA